MEPVKPAMRGGGFIEANIDRFVARPGARAGSLVYQLAAPADGGVA